MAQHFSLSWVPGASATSQTVQYRIKNTSSWTSNTGITPANPLGAGVTSASITSFSNNTIYQVQVLSNCCPGTEAAGQALEGVIYNQQTLTTGVVQGVISMNQTPMTMVDTVTYRLATQNAPTVFLQTVTATGTNPAASFTSVSTGSYIISYSYTTSVNGININSYDATQNNAWYTQTQAV